MSRALLSTDWYRLHGLKPRLRGHVRLLRHVYRGRVWHVVEDRLGGRHHRFNHQAWRVLSLLDGQRSMGQLWDLLVAELSDETPTQDEVIRLLGQLHAADLVQVDVNPDLAELLERRGQHQRRKWLGRVGNPIALRIPLFDPDPLLRALLRMLGPLAGRAGALLWLAVVLPALLLLPSHWAELSATGSEQLLAADNLLLLAVLFPLVKALHELAHGLACRVRGAEVHEAGLMLLALYPVPYVDVSSAAALPGKWPRVLVGAAGMLAELFIAALAFYLWLGLQPGLLRAMAFDVAVLASVTTLFFNANPLLRYDGYYILADLIESPNLGQRGTRWWQYLAERFAFGVREPEPVQATPGERAWFALYAPVSYVYRVFVALSIAWLVAQQFFFVGVLIALWSVGMSVLWPLAKALRALFTAPRFADRVGRVRGVLAASVASLATLLFVLPLAHHTHAEGVLWLPEQAILRASADGFVHQWLAEPGARLAPGQPVLQSVQPALAARMQVQAAKLEEVQVQLDAAWGVQQARAEQLQQDLAREQAALARLRDEAGQLTLRSVVAGELLVDKPEDLPGRWLRKGEVVGYLRSGGAPLVRVVVPQADADAVGLDTRAVQLRFAQDPARSWDARLTRRVPAAERQLPSAVLGTLGGGVIAVDPSDSKGMTTIESMFEFELTLADDAPQAWLGSRVHVRFAHQAEPVGQRLWRGVRRAFLARFQW